MASRRTRRASTRSGRTTGTSHRTRPTTRTSSPRPSRRRTGSGRSTPTEEHEEDEDTRQGDGDVLELRGIDVAPRRGARVARGARAPPCGHPAAGRVDRADRETGLLAGGGSVRAPYVREPDLELVHLVRSRERPRRPVARVAAGVARDPCAPVPLARDDRRGPGEHCEPAVVRLR